MMLIYPAEVLSIKLASASEQDGTCRHVETHCKCFRCKQRLQHNITKYISYSDSQNPIS